MDEIRLLLVEHNLADVRFIRDALAEAEEKLHRGAWVHCRVEHFETAGDAVLVLESERRDVVLFNPNLPGSLALETFMMLRDAAPFTPLIALLDAGEEVLGRTMLRSGAQDYLLKTEIDCTPLAHAILNAIERLRFQRSIRAALLCDLETGFYHHNGFQVTAARDLLLAAQSGREVSLVLAEIDDFTEVLEGCGRKAAHEMILRAATFLRASADETVIFGRLAPARFALLAWSDGAGPLVSRLQSDLASGHNGLALLFGHAETRNFPGADIEELLHVAHSMLSENQQAVAHLA